MLSLHTNKFSLGYFGLMWIKFVTLKLEIRKSEPQTLGLESIHIVPSAPCQGLWKWYYEILCNHILQVDSEFVQVLKFRWDWNEFFSMGFWPTLSGTWPINLLITVSMGTNEWLGMLIIFISQKYIHSTGLSRNLHTSWPHSTKPPLFVTGLNSAK